MEKTLKNSGVFCVCGSGLKAASCCQPLLLGEQHAKSAEQLMRSRYTAYASGDVDYIVRTWHPQYVPSSIEIADDTFWTGLKVVRHRQLGDTEAEVEFIASFVSQGVPAQMHELSRFIRQGEVWLYVDGQQIDSQQSRTVVVPGRNDPCYCGSGKKYKKCCARLSNS